MTAIPLAHEPDADGLRLLNRLLIRAVKALGEEGQTDLACRIAAEAWAALRKQHPEEAAKLNGALHYLTRPQPQRAKGDRHVESSAT